MITELETKLEELNSQLTEAAEQQQQLAAVIDRAGDVDSIEKSLTRQQALAILADKLTVEIADCERELSAAVREENVRQSKELAATLPGIEQELMDSLQDAIQVASRYQDVVNQCYHLSQQRVDMVGIGTILDALTAFRQDSEIRARRAESRQQMRVA